MQAWGATSRFQRRETESFPVKSALTGMVAAALGIDKHSDDEADRLAPLAALRVTVYRLAKGKKGKGTRDEVLRLVDFHTVGGGYDKNASPMEKLSIPKKASGPPFGTVITRRTYLTDARFAAVFEGDIDAIQAAAAALADPCWGVWFGRKTCLPALPLSPTVGESGEAALAALLMRLGEWDGEPCPDASKLERWEEPEAGDPAEGDFFLPDAPVSFGSRTHHERAVRHRRPTRQKQSGHPTGEEDLSEAYFDSIPAPD